LVYENAPDKPIQTAPPLDSEYYYWSNREHRWKPVPPMYSHSRKAAHSAAQDVRRLLRQAALKNPEFATNGNALRLASEQVQSSSTSGPTTSASRNYAALGRVHYRESSLPPNGSEWIDKIVEQAATEHSVDPNLVRAIIKVESNFNPHAVSRKGAMGLMQLMPGTARTLNLAHPFDPSENIDAGVRHLKQLLESFGGDLNLSLAAYNAGSTAVRRNKGVPPYRETQNYVRQITRLYWNGDPGQLSGGPIRNPIRVSRDEDGHFVFSNIE
jgi:soluble lytic murein transglycosylase-like protein